MPAPIPLPEPATGLLVLGAGWLLGKADRWFSNANRSDQATTLALKELSINLKHLDASILTLDGSITRLWSRLDNHERRISQIEGHRRIHATEEES